MVVASTKCASVYAPLVVFGVNSVVLSFSVTNKLLEVDCKQYIVCAAASGRVKPVAISIRSSGKRRTVRIGTSWNWSDTNMRARAHCSSWAMRAMSFVDNGNGRGVSGELEYRKCDQDSQDGCQEPVEVRRP